jgi:hypothetical protein
MMSLVYKIRVTSQSKSGFAQPCGGWDAVCSKSSRVGFELQCAEPGFAIDQEFELRHSCSWLMPPAHLFPNSRENRALAF